MVGEGALTRSYLLTITLQVLPGGSRPGGSSGSMLRRTVLSAAPLLMLGACASAAPKLAQSAPRGFPEVGYATWGDDEPAYRLYPGDQIDVTVPSAPELNRQALTVGPDGRISLPLIPQVMAADLGVAQLEQTLTRAYAGQLNDPRVEVSLKAAVPLRVFVGGEVAKAGVYDMPGDIDALQAVIMAGGFLTSAEPHACVVIRRGADGRPMIRRVNLGRAVRDAPRTDAVPLRRFDVVYVPRSAISNIGLWVQQYLRDVVPVQFSYATGANNYLTTR